MKHSKKYKYVDLINQYDQKTDTVISFPLGREYSFDHEKMIIGNKCNMKNIALGLAGINLVIYNCGDHSEIQNRYSMIYDNTPSVYYLNCSPGHFDDQRRPKPSRERFQGYR